ncbi:MULTISPECIES: MarR family winged helix-turn-helix transcriptional regulator [Streptacidiphilus]|uniref:MarR family winged helix-turn-helix transcriptional regulator n=2 Tax=Streptacidiphilus TaxID=228398 RepID=A0ABV6UQX6_9ACTN|nr:MarR family transcriptional regulator [Streptacidiphilus jeojiense]
MDPLEPAVSSTAAQAAADLRVLLGRLRRRLKEVDNTDGITASQLSVLSRLDREGPAAPGVLAAAERVRPQSMGATLAALEERALIERRPDPADGRRQVVSLTDEGTEAITGTRRVREEWLARALQDRYTAAERATVVEALALLERLDRA